MTLEEIIKAEESEVLAHSQTLDSLDENMPTDIREDFEKSIGQYMEYHQQLAELLRELKKNREILDGLRIYFQSLVVDAVFNQRPMMFDMRDATKEERESVKRYIADSVSTTGVNFWHLIGEVKVDE